MIRLIAKEIRQLFPITILWIAILILNYGYLFFTKRVDEQSYFGWCEDYCARTIGPELLFPFVALILVVAYSLFPREHDETTIDLLYSMPISRVGVFIAKTIAALTIMSVLIVLDYLIDPTLLKLNRSSMDGQFYANIFWPMVFRDLMFAYVILCYGILLSWLRTIGLILFIAYIITIGIVENVFGGAGAFNLFSFHNNDYLGQGLALNWSTITPHLIVATIALIAGGILWTNTDSKKSQKSKINSKWISIPLSILAFIVLFVAISFDGKFNNDETNTTMVAAETDHYRFVYKSRDAAPAKALIELADDDYKEIAALLNAKSDPYIQTDLTQKLAHAAGLASWKTIKMDLSINDEQFDRHVLSHETVHVFQGVESNRAMMEARGHTKFFTEGMADYVAQITTPYTAVKEINETVGAVSWKLQKIRFEDIIDYNNFQEKFNPELVYTMGSLWSEAMAETCGIESLGDVLRAMGRDNAPRGLPGKVFWQDSLQHIKCELESVNSSWRKLMQQQIDNDDTRWVTDFSEIRFSTSEDGQYLLANVIAKPHPDFPQAMATYVPGSFDIRIANESQFTKSGDYYVAGAITDDSNPNALQVEFQIHKDGIPSKQFRYQLGVSTHPKSFGYFGSWQKGRIP